MHRYSKLFQIEDCLCLISIISGKRKKEREEKTTHFLLLLFVVKEWFRWHLLRFFFFLLFDVYGNLNATRIQLLSINNRLESKKKVSILDRKATRWILMQKDGKIWSVRMNFFRRLPKELFLAKICWNWLERTLEIKLLLTARNVSIWLERCTSFLRPRNINVFDTKTNVAISFDISPFLRIEILLSK